MLNLAVLTTLHIIETIYHKMTVLSWHRQDVGSFHGTFPLLELVDKQTADFGSFHGTVQQVCNENEWVTQKLSTIGSFDTKTQTADLGCFYGTFALNIKIWVVTNPSDKHIRFQKVLFTGLKNYSISIFQYSNFHQWKHKPESPIHGSYSCVTV